MWSEEFISSSFHNMDVDKDGRLDTKELEQGLALASTDIQEILRLAKPDKDG